MRIVLRGRRTFLLWSSTLLCGVALALSALTASFGNAIPSALRVVTSAPQAPDVGQLITSYRDGQRAVLQTLDEEVLEQLPVFAQGKALDEVIIRVRTLRAAGYFQKLEIERVEILQVIEDEPYIYVIADELHTFETYQVVSGRLLERKSVRLEVIYHLLYDSGRWKVAKVITSERF